MRLSEDPLARRTLTNAWSGRESQGAALCAPELLCAHSARPESADGRSSSSLEKRIHGNHRARRQVVCGVLPRSAGANGQGRTKIAARKNLAGAIALIPQDRRTDALRGLPRGATRETVTVE